MSIEEAVVEQLKALPPDKQHEVLEFVKTLRIQGTGDHTPSKSLLGLWADFDVKVTEEDIAEARREMWGNFPRDINQ